MGNCIYCREPAGFLKKSHKECKQRHDQGKTEIVSLIGKVISEGGDMKRLETSIEQVVATSYIGTSTINALIVSGWERAVDAAFDDGILTEEEESALSKLKQHFSLSQQELDRNGAFTKFVKGAVLRDKQRHDQGKTEIVSLIGKVISEGGDIKCLETSIEQVAATSHIDTSTMNALIVSGWERAVDAAFDDGILTEEEESALSELEQHFSLSQQELDRNGAFTKFVKGAVLRDIFDGKLSERIKIDGSLPFNLQKTEKVVWIFQDVDYYEEKTRTRYVGGSQGVSIRIAKGLYYRAGAFKGERIQTSETIHADTGLLGVTNKHIYFAGPSKRFRINYNKIVAFEPFSDGIGVQRDVQTAKLQLFYTGDGRFTYNLITNLAQM